jgi:hypothetical protein
MSQAFRPELVFLIALNAVLSIEASALEGQAGRNPVALGCEPFVRYPYLKQNIPWFPLFWMSVIGDVTNEAWPGLKRTWHWR